MGGGLLWLSESVVDDPAGHVEGEFDVEIAHQMILIISIDLFPKDHRIIKSSRTYPYYRICHRIILDAASTPASALGGVQAVCHRHRRTYCQLMESFIFALCAGFQ